MVGFVLSKLLPLLVLPLGAALVLLTLALVLRRRWLVVSALGVLWLFSTGLIAQLLWRLVEAPWQRRTADTAPRTDAIVVLSGGSHAAPGAARIVEWEDPDRFLAGVALYQSKRAPLLLFTGGQNPFHPGLAPEGELYRSKAVALGVPRAAIAMTPVVRNTAEEAGAIRQLLPGSQPRVLLVTSAFTCSAHDGCLSARGSPLCRSPLISRPVPAGQVRFGVILCSGCPTPAAWTTAPGRFGNCWADWSIAPGESTGPVNPVCWGMISVMPG